MQSYPHSWPNPPEEEVLSMLNSQDQFLDEDKLANPQLTKKFFIRTPYIFTLSSLDKKHDHMISEALIDIQAYEN